MTLPAEDPASFRDPVSNGRQVIRGFTVYENSTFIEYGTMIIGTNYNKQGSQDLYFF